jgi:mono/diheme cytochrome c family protein
MGQVLGEPCSADQPRVPARGSDGHCQDNGGTNGRRRFFAAAFDPSQGLFAALERGFTQIAGGSSATAANMGAIVIIRLVFSLLLLGISAGFAEEAGPSPLEQRGRALAEQMCSQCHAVGRSGQSPHAGAPAFRRLDRRVDLDTFMDRLREGLMVGHPDMPTFRFTREDARAFVLYVRSIQAP